VQKRLVIAALITLLAVGPVSAADARGGHYIFEGGTARQQAQVHAALQTSGFDWNVVHATVTIHLHPGTDSYATKGDIWIDTKLLASGVFAWGPIQHEYGHQVDFFLLDAAKRAELAAALGAKIWAHDWTKAGMHGPDHSTLGAERFASTLAWAYWQSDANSLRPTSKNDESAAMAPGKFRALLKQMLGVPNPLPPVVIAR